ncbi:MAG: nuclear transport factor 2 family protein, partial [Sphingobacteriia bacterium]
MKLTKKIEAEITSVYDTYWKALLIADIDNYTSVLDENFKLIGSTESEVFFKSIEAIKFLEVTADQVAGNIELRNRVIKIELIETLILVTEQSDTYVKIDANWSFYGKARISTLIGKKKQEWKIIQMHLSFPDSKADEGQTIGLDKISKENLELRDAIKRRTIELENKNRELEIETALEKVRAVAMGMKKAEDMLSICKTISQQLIQLGVKEIRNVQTAIFYESRGTYMNYEYYAKHDKTFITEVDYKNHKIQLAFAKKMLKGPNEEVLEQLKGKKLQDWYIYQKSTNQFADKYLLKAHSLNYYWYSLGPVALGISTYYPLTNDETNLFKRFLKVFELAYRRYLDIEKAEAQAREAQIETALERVRSRSIAMHSSDELKEVIMVVIEQLKKLGFDLDLANFNFRINSKDWSMWLATPNYAYPEIIHLPYLKSPLFDHPIEAVKQGLDFMSDVLTYEEKNRAMHHFNENTILKQYDSDERKRYIAEGKGLARSIVFMKSIILTISNFKAIPYLEEENEIVKRFATVFEQSYTRFLDLQKAEAQTKEAKIEASLERVRSHTMGLRKSDELEKVMSVIFEEFTKLGLDVYESGIFLRKDKSREFSVWGKSILEDGFFTNYDFPFLDHTILNQVISNLENQKEYAIFSLHGADLKSYLKMMFAIEQFKTVAPETKAAYFSLKNIYVAHAYFQHGFLEIAGESPIEADMVEVARKFTQVIDLAYTRFLDLKKAEEQAREAQIEAALERVRAASMAMHSSQELKEVALELRKQMGLLGQKDLEVCAIHLYDEENSFESWSAMRAPGIESKILQTQARFPNKGIKIVDELMKQNKRGSKDYVLVNEGEKSVEWLNLLKKITPELHAYIIKSIGKLLKSHWSVADFTGGALVIVTYGEPDMQTRNLLRRSANVFEQAYIRFLDLKKAEAQAREAQIEAALERVRAASMAMRDSSALSEIIYKVYVELTKLDAQLDRCFIMIVNPDNKGITWWMAGHEGLLAENGFFIPMNQHASHLWYLDCWKNRKKKWQYLLEGKEKRDWDRFGFSETELVKLPEPVKEFMASQKKVHLSGSSDQFGSLVTGSFEPLPEEQQNIISRFSISFNQVYTRFLDLQKAEAQAREAQIEAALEKVRSVAMSMHHSNELLSICESIYVELLKLNITELRNTMINIHNDADETFLNYDYSAYAGKAVTKYGYHIHPIINQLVMQCRSTHDAFLDIALAGEEFETWR